MTRARWRARDLKRRRVYGLTPQTDLGGAAASEARGAGTAAALRREQPVSNSCGGTDTGPRSTRVRSVPNAKRTQSTRMRREGMSRQMRHTRSELTSRSSPRRFGLRTGQLKPTGLVCMLRMNQRQRRIKQGEHKAQEPAVVLSHCAQVKLMQEQRARSAASLTNAYLCLCLSQPPPSQRSQTVMS